MSLPAFRVRRYAHPKYKFVVRAKVDGKWKRRYFRSEREAVAYARKQNAVSQSRFEPPVRPPGPLEGDHVNRRSAKMDSPVSRPAPAKTLMRNAVVILGMHRSGTSALAGSLNILGVDFGKNLAPAEKDNEKGYWENPEIVTLHDQLLRLLGSRWDDDAPLPEKWMASGVAREIQSLLRGVLDRDFSGLPLFGLKDPRMCRLMPLWLPIFEKLRIQPHFLLSVRHPWEVVQSLARRDKLDPARSYLLWLEHTLEAEAATRGFPRSFVSYEGLVENPLAAVNRLQEELGLSLAVPSRAEEALATFLAPSLRHHYARAGGEGADAVPPLALEVYEAMSAGSGTEEIASKLAVLGEQFKRGGSLFFPRLGAIEARIASIDQQIPGDAEAVQRENLVRLQIFRPASDGYHESDSETRYFAGGSWSLLTIDLPATPHVPNRPLRIDPASYPAVIDVAEIAMKRTSTGELLWSATSENEFAGFEVGGTACRLFHERYLRILSFGADPQLLLPAPTVRLLETPMRLELLLLVDNTPGAISSSITAMKTTGAWDASSQERERVRGKERFRERNGHDQAGAIGTVKDFASPLELMHPDGLPSTARYNLVQKVSPVYFGPRIERYFGDHWSMHLPFAYELMSEFRPRVFVELGVWKGESYFTFCQSAVENNVAVRCFGIDSWRGDVHMGKLDEELRQEVDRYNSARYAEFSELKAKTFEEALGDFADESIDLLHIDGTHTYEEVRRDFESWLPKLSPKGVVLFHDVAVHGGGFGVWKLWQELAAQGSSFVFEFGYGLGIWQRNAIAASDHSFLGQLFLANEQERQLINRHYATAASALALWESEKATQLSLHRANENARATTLQVEVHNQEISRLERCLEEGRAQVRDLSTQLDAAHAQDQIRQTQLKTNAEELEARQSAISTLQTTVAALETTIATLNQNNLDLASTLEAERRLGAEQARHRAEQISRQSEQIRKQAELISSRDEQISQQAALINSRDEQIRQEAERSRKLSEQIDLAAKAAQATNKQLDEGRAEARRLLASSQLWKAQVEGAQAYQAQLNEQRDKMVVDLVQTAAALHGNKEGLSSAFDLVSADIEQIRHPTFWWKLMGWLGFLRLTPPGAPRTTAERRAIATELKAGLREIDRALSSKTLIPEEAAGDIRRLFELRSRASAIVRSLRFPKILSRKSKPWTFIPWTGRAPSVVSRTSPAAILFDAPWYLGKYPDVAAAGIDPLTHYLKCGVEEHRNPNPLFDTAWYRTHNSDVATEGVHPLEHYVLCGAAEGRDPSPLFSTSWYLKRNPDVAQAGVHPLQHYLEHGIPEGRDPHPLFETAYYLAQAPEAAGTNPVEHYLNAGGDVSPHPLFAAKWYLEQYSDVAAAGVNPLLHYLNTGAAEGRDPHPLFDTSWYLDVNPDVRASGINPLVHYLAAGSEEGRDPHPLFDTSWYRAKYSVNLASGYEPLSHYLKQGWLENLDPHPLFDTSWYLALNGDVAAHGINPLVHFQLGGGIEGRDPHPLFDSSWYLESNPDALRERTNPLFHYLSMGAKSGRDPHPLFQTKYYNEQRRAREFPAAELSKKSRSSSGRKVSSKTGGQKGVVYAFTSICLNYVPKAVVLARTLKKYNPDIRFCVLVSDRIPEGALDLIDVFDEVVGIEELDIANKPSWIFRHTVVELCTAVKGYFIVDLLEREDCAAAFYFDPDIVCFSSLDVLKDKLERASILLTPHLTDPEVTDEAIRDNEICALRHGVYNLGFLGLRPSPEGNRFARWWRDRLRDFCRADIPGGLFTDQRWVDLAPALFQELEIVRHPGCNAATWNLTNRNIEGDFTTGFTVNGEPLIFYHFSGFDSGAQGAMLDKYGGEMPAAQLLRKWYEEETTRSGEARFNHFPWTLGSFSNGEPISDAHRILYRDRADLQQAFPNPFDASAPGHSYYHWYHSEVLGKPIDSAGGNFNPVIEFVDEKAPLSPNPFFDCDWYLQHNPDVVAQGINPLVHFIRNGANEGRSPNPNFFPAYYREQLRPDERLENPLAHYILHGQKEGRRTDPRYHPTLDAALRRRISRWAKSGPPLILLVSHYGGGGTEKHLRDLTDSVGEDAQFLQLTPGHDGFVRLSPRDPDFSSKLVFDPAQQFDALAEVIQECEPRRIHIHHILGNEEYLSALVYRLKLPFDFTIHDYYVLAPSPHLVGPDGRFVGDDLEAHEGDLLAASIARRRPASLAAWQDAHRWLVTDADRVIVPSQDVARRFSRFFPAVRPIVSAHPEAPRLPREITFPALTPSATLRVAVLGDLLRHKGKDTLVECAKIVQSSADKIRFELIGDAHDDSELLREAGVWFSGRYEEEEFRALLARRQPQLIWYPALCPETYSYTLSVALESGIPLAVTDLGALPERVAGHPWTWICPWEYTAADWLSFFRRIREKNFVPKLPPKAPAGVTPATSNFYSADYLAVLSKRSGQEPAAKPQPAITR